MHVEVNGSRLWFDVDGAALVPHGAELRERPTVVLLHGGPGSFDHSYFKPDFERLAEVAQVVYLDLLGHGRSTWGDSASWSFEPRSGRRTGATVRPSATRSGRAAEGSSVHRYLPRTTGTA
jgi:pimeloyl-ACP methyl ester carboxylesterase